MKKIISTANTPENIEKILAILSTTPAKLIQLSKTLPHNKPLAEGERTFTENITHLIHVEALSSQSIYVALMLDQPMLHPLHAERDLGKLLQLDKDPVKDLLNYFKFRRDMLIRVLRNLTPDQWTRTVQEVGKKRQESVYWRARGLALHELEHLTDLESKL